MATFSVIVPLFNEKKRVENLLNNLIEIFDETDQIIIINDGSTDNTGKYIEEILKVKKLNHVTYINNNINRGVSFSRNLGIIESKKEYILFLDADDVLELNFKSVINEKIRKYPQVDVIRFNHNISMLTGFNDVFVKNFYDIPKEFIKSYYLHSSCTQVCKRDLIKSINFNEEITFGEDLLFVFELLNLAHSILLTDEILYHYNFVDNSLSNKIEINHISKRIKSITLVYNKILFALENKSEISDIYVSKFLMELSLQILKISKLSSLEYDNFVILLQPLFDTKWKGKIDNIFKLHASLISKNRIKLAKMVAHFYSLLTKFK